MRETKFIEQNKEKWAAFERSLQQEGNSPAALDKLFVQITDDLSYSRTFYPNRSVRVYLNGLAQQIFVRIYKNRQSDRRRLLTFWTDELPQLLYHARRDLLLSFLVFVLGMLIGMVSGAMDSEFAQVILGESYVEMTLENIRSGDPLAVYKESSPFGMSFGITLNNLFVAFLTFVMGIFASIGAIIILFRNAVMVGVFQYFFIEQDLFIESFLTIWTHGTLEISAIIIAGAAGITLGRGLVFPGTLTRTQAFQRSARRGLKIMIGIVPIIVAAGFIEGYLTRFTETPNLIRLFFILICLTLVLTYYVWYPFKKAKTGFRYPLKDTRLPPTANQQIDYRSIKSVGDIFTDIFRFYRRHLGRIFKLTLGTAAFYTIATFLLARVAPSELFLFPQSLFGTSSVIEQFFVHENIIGFPLINVVVYSTLVGSVFTFLLKEANRSINNVVKFSSRHEWKSLLQIVLLVVLTHLLIWWSSGFTLLLLLITLPIFMLWAYVIYEEKKYIFAGLGRTFNLLNGQFLTLYGLFLSVALLAYFLFSILDTMVVSFFLEPLTWVFPYNQTTLDDLNIILLTFITMFSLHLLLTMVLLGSGLLYYSLLEVQEATSLLEKVRRIGATRFIKGLERE